MDIDLKLVKTAWKNLYRLNVINFYKINVFITTLLVLFRRDYLPTLAPDGRPFPLSITHARGPMTVPLPTAVMTPPTTQKAREEREEASTSLTAKKGVVFPHNVEFVHVSVIVHV